MTPHVRDAVTRWFEEVWNHRSRDAIDRMMHPDCLTAVEGRDAPLTRDDFKEYHRAFLNAVPDIKAEVLWVIAEGDTAIASWRGTGTHTGAGLGIPPSGRPVDFTGLSVFEFEDGRIARGFDKWNRGEMIASLMQVRMDDLQRHAQLTRREAQVALLMAERFTHAEIATQLNIKPNTARRHCERVMLKLGVSRRQDVAGAVGRIPGSVLDRHGADFE
ncbi:MAG TPA: ester cyclase [Longimicrobiales bacterium]